MGSSRKRPATGHSAGASLLPRDRLRRRLAAGFSNGLTLVVAPAGYGKTTLLTGWARAEGQGYASLYYAFAEADNDPAHLLAGVAAAVRDALAQAFSVQLESQDPLAYSLNLLFRRAAEATHCRWLLVVDDYHLATNPAIHQALDALLSMPAWPVYPVIASRTQPPAPAIARLRVEGRLAEINETDLRFTADETRSLLAGAGLVLDEGDLRQIMERTEGWPAAVELVCQAARREPHPDIAAILGQIGDERPLFDYLAGQVLDRQPVAIQDFLRRTALLPYLSPELCNAFLGIDDALAILDGLLRDHLFVSPLDGRPGHRFRYHTLFQGFLRRCLEQAEGASGLDAWHRRAAACLLKEPAASHSLARVDDQAAAIQHLLAAREWSGAAQAVEMLVDMLDIGSLPRLEPWLERLPGEMMASRPRLLVALGRVRERQGRWSEALAVLVQAERAARAAGSTQDVHQALRWQAWVHFLQDRYAQAVGLCRRALAVLAGEPEDEPASAAPVAPAGPGLESGVWAVDPTRRAALAEIYNVLGNCYASSGDPDRGRQYLMEALSLFRSLGNREREAAMLHNMAAYYLLQGLLRETIEAEETSLRILEDLNSFGVSRPLVILGMAYLQCGDMEAARSVLRRLLLLTDTYKDSRGRAYALVLLGQLHREEGDRAAARRCYEEAGTVAGQIEDRILSFELHRGLARLALDSADWHEARRQSLAALQLARQPVDRQLEGRALATLGQVEDASGDLRQAETHYRQALQLAEAAGGHMDEAAFHLLLADFLHREGRDEEAGRHLARALALSSTYGYEFLFTRRRVGRAVPLLTMALRQPSETTDIAAIRRMLVAIGQPAVEPLLALLAGAGGDDCMPAARRVEVQGTVAALLGEIGDERTIPALSHLRKSHDSRLRDAAQGALARIAAAPRPPLSAAALGGFHVQRASLPIPAEAWQPRRKARLLLLYLLTHAPRRVPCDQVLDALWPDLPPNSAALALNTTFSDLRRILEPYLGKGQPSHYLVRDEETLALNPAAEIWYDVAAFQQAVRMGGQSVRQAMELYKGDFLPEEPYVDWVLRERERLRGLYLNTLAAWLDEQVQAGAWREGAELARRILALEPWLEEVWRALMTCLARLGRRSEALQAYQACVRALRDELDAAPSAETRALFEQLMV